MGNTLPWRRGTQEIKQSNEKVIVRSVNGVLNLCKMALIDEDLPKVVKGNLIPVHTLLLRENNISGEGIAYLIDHPTLHLIKLNIACNELTDESLRFLSGSKWQLKQLLLNKNNITGPGLRYLTTNSHQHLQVLNLNQNYINDYGAQLLSHWQCPALTALFLFANCLKDAGVKRVVRWALPALTHLHIAANYHTSWAVMLVLQGKWADMKEMQLYSDLIPYWEKPFLEKALKIKWPRCQIYL